MFYYWGAYSLGFEKTHFLLLDVLYLRIILHSGKYSIYSTTQQNILENLNIQQQSCENLRSNRQGTWYK